jgi:4-nitrophenyl phosphatase
MEQQTMSPTTAWLSQIRAALFDMDGVVYVGKRPLPGVQAMFDYLDANGCGWLCITNNASMTSQQFADKLAAMDIQVSPARILGSSEATATWLAEQVENGWPRGEVFVMGMEGLRAALQAKGFTLTSDPFAAAYVVSGANFNLTFSDLADAALAIRNGARFIGTNGDLTFPTERGQIPGAGSVLALFTAATGVSPIVIGKPNPPMFEIALHRLGVAPHETMMVGDRYDTDIAGAIAMGLKTVGVLTGIDTRAHFEAQQSPPHLVAEDLAQLLGWMKTI